MKKSIFLLFILAFVFTAQAKVWRVNNNAAMNANFTSFVEAQSKASENDTLYFEGSTESYGNIVLSKSLILIGPGYFLTENTKTQANAIPATFGSITFDSGSSSSIITGLTVTGNIEIKVGKIAIISNNIAGNINFNSTVSFGNIIISQNYIERDFKNIAGTALLYNLIITNNFFHGSTIRLNNNYSGVFSNNTVYSGYDHYIQNFHITNNIISGDDFPINNIYYNNIGDNDQFPVGNENKQNVNMADVFVGKTGNSIDGQWQLKPYSPALKAGNDGTDCGMFGGSSPYVLSGLPSIPAIYEIIMPSTGDNINGIDVTIKAKTH